MVTLFDAASVLLSEQFDIYKAASWLIVTAIRRQISLKIEKKDRLKK